MASIDIEKLAASFGSVSDDKYDDRTTWEFDKAALVQFAEAYHQAKCKQVKPLAYLRRNEYNEYRLEPIDYFKVTDLPIEVNVLLYPAQPDQTAEIERLGIALKKANAKIELFATPQPAPSADDAKDAERFRSLVDKERCVTSNKCLIQVIDATGNFTAEYFKAPDDSDRWKDLPLAENRLDALRKAVDKSNQAIAQELK